jgi:hypothetical protein
MSSGRLGDAIPRVPTTSTTTSTPVTNETTTESPEVSSEESLLVLTPGDLIGILLSTLICCILLLCCCWVINHRWPMVCLSCGTAVGVCLNAAHRRCPACLQACLPEESQPAAAAPATLPPDDSQENAAVVDPPGDEVLPRDPSTYRVPTAPNPDRDTDNWSVSQRRSSSSDLSEDFARPTEERRTAAAASTSRPSSPVPSAEDFSPGEEGRGTRGTLSAGIAFAAAAVLARSPQTTRVYKAE